MIRTFYRCLLWLHPPNFRRQFGGEMLWIFDQAASSQGAGALFVDGLGSLARQWLLRSGWWKVAAALALALLEVIFGGFGTLLLGPRRILPPGPAIPDTLDFANHGSIAHQPLTIGILMYLAVFVIGGLVVLIIGLTYWMKGVSTRRRPVAHRVR
jgi:hypothetical protein